MGNRSALYFRRLPLFNSANASLFANAHQLISAAIIKSPIQGRNEYFHFRENGLRKIYANDENIRETCEKGTIKINILMTLDFGTFLLKYLFFPRILRDICFREKIFIFTKVFARYVQDKRKMRTLGRNICCFSNIFFSRKFFAKTERER
jgi:hypothetical protein